MIELLVFGLGSRSLDQFEIQAKNSGIVVLFRQGRQE